MRRHPLSYHAISGHSQYLLKKPLLLGERSQHHLSALSFYLGVQPNVVYYRQGILTKRFMKKFMKSVKSLWIATNYHKVSISWTAQSSLLVINMKQTLTTWTVLELNNVHGDSCNYFIIWKQNDIWNLFLFTDLLELVAANGMQKLPVECCNWHFGNRRITVDERKNWENMRLHLASRCPIATLTLYQLKYTAHAHVLLLVVHVIVAVVTKVFVSLLDISHLAVLLWCLQLSQPHVGCQ